MSDSQRDQMWSEKHFGNFKSHALKHQSHR